MDALRNTLANYIPWIIALHIIAALLFASSAYAAGGQMRVGLVFVLAMSSLVTLLGVAAYELSLMASGTVDARLKTLAALQASSQIGCPF